MGYLNNSTITVDAILTKKGRELLAAGSSDFNITQFALGDDEVDYGLWNINHPLGSSYYGVLIENMPLVEAIPFYKVTDDMITAQEQLSKNAEIMRQTINDIFAPTEMKFKVDMAELDVVDAIAERNALQQEGVDLNKEDVELAKELEQLKTTHYIATAFAKSLIVSVFPVPAGPDGLPP